MLNKLTFRNFPYISILLVVIIFTARGVANTKMKEYNTGNLKYEEYLPIFLAWLVENKLSVSIPFLSLFGVGQFSAPDSETGGKAVVVVGSIILISALCIIELWYGHSGILLLLLVCIMAYTFAYTFQTVSCHTKNSKNKKNILTQQIATGSFLTVFFASACVNILLSYGIIGIITGIIFHSGMLGMLFALDLNKSFKAAATDTEKMCYTLLNHPLGYLLGLLISLLLMFSSIKFSKPSYIKTSFK